MTHASASKTVGCRGNWLKFVVDFEVEVFKHVFSFENSNTSVAKIPNLRWLEQGKTQKMTQKMRLFAAGTLA